MCRLVFRASLAPTGNIDESCLAQQSLVRSPTCGNVPTPATATTTSGDPKTAAGLEVVIVELGEQSLSSHWDAFCEKHVLAGTQHVYTHCWWRTPPPLKVLPAWKEHPRWPCHPDCGNLASTFSATAQGLSFSSVSYARRNTAVYGFSVPKTAPKSYNKEYYAATCLVQ